MAAVKQTLDVHCRVSVSAMAPLCKLLLFFIIFFDVNDASTLTPVLNNTQTEMGRNITQILESFFSSGYDKRVRPNYAGKPVQVGVTLYIISISSVSEIQMDFTCDFYFRQGWRDPRLAFKPRKNLESLKVGAEVAKQIWVPDTFFANEKSAQFHTATTPNTFIRISSNGDVFRSTRLTVTSSCPMNLQYFPLDGQECSIEIESYGYSMADIVYTWGIDKKPDPAAAKISDDVSLPQFKVTDLKQDTKVEYLVTGNYSRLVCKLKFVRSMGYYLIQIYIPASLIVIISWVSFWLHRNASPARVQLGVTTVLTMTTLMSSTNAALPKISYVKSIDVYLGTCFVMVFASLLEYATVGYMGKRIAMRTTKTQQLAKATARRSWSQKVTANHVEMGLSSRPPHVHPRLMNYASEPLLGYQSPRHRNSMANVPEMRYRLVGLGMPTQGGPGMLGNGRLSVDYSRKKLSLAPVESDTEGGSRESSSGAETPGTPASAIPVPGSRNQTLFGVCPSDIDKYSRVVFPVCFLCFNLMYWIIYMHISAFLTGDFDN